MKIIGLVFTLLFFTSVNSQNISKLVKEANSLYKSGKYDQSLKLCEVILMSDKADVDAMTNKASACWISSWVYKNPGYSLNSITKSLEFADKTYEIYSNLITEHPETEKVLNGLMASITQERDVLRKMNSEFANNPVDSKLSDNKKDNSETNGINENLELKKEKNSSTNNNASTNTDDKTVTLTVTGQGKTIDEAKANALRSAIEQAFGAFISSNTTILNDKLVKDEIVSVTNGNIQKYDVLNEMPLPNGTYVTTLKAKVSVSQLTSFCESKGIAVEFKGGLFAMNMQMRELQEKNEKIAWASTKDLIDKIISTSINCDIKITDPKFIDESTYKIPINIKVNLNNNVGLAMKYVKDFCLGSAVQDINSYKQINKSLFSLNVFSQHFYFRNENVRNEIFNLPYLLIAKIIENIRVNNGLHTYSLFQLSNSTRIKIFNDDSYYNYIAGGNMKDWFCKLFGYYGSEISLEYISFKKEFCISELICGNEYDIVNYLKTENVLLETHTNQRNVLSKIEDYICKFERLNGQFLEFNTEQEISLNDVKKINQYKIELIK